MIARLELRGDEDIIKPFVERLSEMVHPGVSLTLTVVDDADDSDDKESWRESPIEELGLGPRAYFTLIRTGVRTIGDLVERTAGSLRALPNVGKKTIEEIEEALQSRGLSLKQGY